MSDQLVINSLLESILNSLPYSWFPSSEYVVSRIIQLAALAPGQHCLDVCAGDGRLAQAARSRGAAVEVIELNPVFQQILFQRGFSLVGEDVIRSEPQRAYERVISNPPFSFSPTQRGVDLAIIERAYREFLAPGGRLVSVVSASHRHSRDANARIFRGWLKQIDARLVELPLEAFWGTERPVTVEAWLLVADKHYS